MDPDGPAAAAAVPLPKPQSHGGKEANDSVGTESSAAAETKHNTAPATRSRVAGAEDVITANVVKLCNKVLPGVSDSMLQYCMKILGSRLAAGPSAVRSELHVLGKIRKLLQRKGIAVRMHGFTSAKPDMGPWVLACCITAVCCWWLFRFPSLWWRVCAFFVKTPVIKMTTRRPPKPRRNNNKSTGSGSSSKTCERLKMLSRECVSLRS